MVIFHYALKESGGGSNSSSNLSKLSKEELSNDSGGEREDTNNHSKQTVEQSENGDSEDTGSGDHFKESDYGDYYNSQPSSKSGEKSGYSQSSSKSGEESYSYF